MTRRDVLAVVVTHDRLPLLRRTISALRDQASPCDILVVENACTDGTCSFLSDEGADLFVLHEERNVGGAGGFTDGILYGLRRGYPFLWLMDDDVLPETNALSALLTAHSDLDGRYGFLSSLALFRDGTAAKMNNCLLSGKTTADCAAYQGQNTYFRITTATFVSFFLPTSVVRQFGLPIREMFLWGEDTEYSSRIAKSKPGYFVPQSVVLHLIKDNASPDLVTLSPDRIERGVLHVRNRFYIARRDGFMKILRFFARHFLLFFRILFFARDNKLRRLFALLRGIVKGFFFFPKKPTPL